MKSALKKNLTNNQNIRSLTLLVIILLFITNTLFLRSSQGAFVVEEGTYQGLQSISLLNFIPPNVVIQIIIGLAYVLIIGMLLFIRNKITEKVFITSVIFITSPPVVYGFLNMQLSLLVFILTTFIWASIQKNNKIITFTLAVITSLAVFPLAIGYACGLFALKKYSKNEELLKHTFLIIFCTSLIKALFIQTTFIPTPTISVISQFVQEFGSYYGLSFMMIMLAILGAVLVAKHRSLFVGTVLMVLIGLLYQDTLLASIGTLIFASILIHKISTMVWTAKAFQIGVYIFLAISILNAGVIFSLGYIDSVPSNDLTHTYQAFENISTQEVLVPLEAAHYFEYTSKKKAFSTSDTLIKQKISNQIYHSTDLNRTITLLQDNNISHIVITEEMLTDIWKNKQKGLLIMVSNEKHFQVIYSGTSSVIYQVQ
jgi:hypothetical protein